MRISDWSSDVCSSDLSVSLYVDGVYAGRSRQAQAPFFDLERVEVLRGPQGALFGKNTAAGAVSVVSAGPTSTPEGAFTALYNFDHKGKIGRASCRARVCQYV